MDVPRPVLMLVVPRGWGLVSEALKKLRRCLGKDYGASLHLFSAFYQVELDGVGGCRLRILEQRGEVDRISG